MDIFWEEKKHNLKRIEEFIRLAAERGCEAAVLPEMCTTGFSFNVSKIAEDVEGKTGCALSRMSEKYGIALIAGFSGKGDRPQKGRNLAVVYDDRGRCIATYTKMYPFSYGGEAEHYEAGEKTVIFHLGSMTAGVFICYDLRFPELFRCVAKEVQALFVIANWPTARKMHWEALLRARAIENQCFVLGVNRVGSDGNNLDYSGGSQVFGPTGESLCSGTDKEECIVVEIDPGDVHKVRSTYPFLNDMRPFTLNLPTSEREIEP